MLSDPTLRISRRSHTTRLISLCPITMNTHLTPLIPQRSSQTIHFTPLIPHRSFHTANLTPLFSVISHHSSHTTHLTPVISHYTPHTTHPTPLISHHSSYTTYLTSFISHHTYLTTHRTHLLHYTSQHIIIIQPFSSHLSLNLSSYYPYHTSRLYTLEICKAYRVGFSGPFIFIRYLLYRP